MTEEELRVCRSCQHEQEQAQAQNQAQEQEHGQAQGQAQGQARASWEITLDSQEIGHLFPGVSGLRAVKTVDEDEYERRLGICLQCDSFQPDLAKDSAVPEGKAAACAGEFGRQPGSGGNSGPGSPSGTCRWCGCRVRTRAKLKAAVCPHPGGSRWRTG
ncbi:MAG TPA: hypothetical protein DD727_04540 [Clostridiales bacterium]|nr:hypothetical protein [Clostridiales bacterium]